MMSVIIENPSLNVWNDILERPTQKIENIEHTVLDIFVDIKRNGDKAIVKYSKIFDNCSLNEFEASKDEILSASNNVSDDIKSAIALAKQNINKFHESQKRIYNKVETTKGVQCWQEERPIENIAIYIPGGSAPLFSTVLMLAIPAKIAGCKSVTLLTPPDSEGKIAPEILFAANECGVDKIFKIGGIQAIAAVTFGTETVSKVSKIFGPGNQYVTVAKQLATKYWVAIDMPAGPSELLVVADDSAIPAYVASDLLSQAEHGPDSQVVLVSTSMSIVKETIKEIQKQIEKLPRKAIAQKAIDNSKFIYFDSPNDALDLINSYGPEHFIINVKDESFYVNGVINAGSVFIGNYTPESAGDYASGTNHTLPTNGYSKAYSGVNLDSFLKQITFQKITREGLVNIGSAIEVMADAEGLQAHKNAVSIRLKDL